jgi:predicted naringenin-chalcone synthase
LSVSTLTSTAPKLVTACAPSPPIRALSGTVNRDYLKDAPVTTARITHIGAAAPVSMISQEELLAYCRRDDARLSRPDVSETIMRKAGVGRRHMAVNPLNETISDWSTGMRLRRHRAEAAPLAHAAVKETLAQTDLGPADFGLITAVTSTGYHNPGLDVELIQDLSMAPNVQRLLIGHMGCFAAVPGLAACMSFVKAHARPALMVNVELSSLHMPPPPWDVEQAVAASLFGDAATAVVLEPGRPGMVGMDIVDIEAAVEPAHIDDMTLEIGDHGFRMTLSPQVPGVLKKIVPSHVGNLLARNDVNLGDVAWWAVHPGGPKILDAVEESLALDPSALAASRAVLRDFGNCASATLPLVIKELMATAPLRPGEYGVAMAFGPGLTSYAALLRGA